MPNYDVECPNCGTYERFKRMDDRLNPCDDCGAPVDILITSSTSSKGFESYWDDGLGAEVTGIGHRHQLMRQEGAEYRDHPSPGEASARRDRKEQNKRLARERRIA